MSALVVNPEPTSSLATLAHSPGGGGRAATLAPLRVPLAIKLVGANLVAVLLLLAFGLADNLTFHPWMILVILGILAGHAALVLVALHPIRDLETVARAVWRGDYAARVGRSAVADRGVLRVGAMFNILLDGLATDRARMRELARDVIDAGDRERAALARELQDSTAQHVAALLFELSAVTRDVTDPVLAKRLGAARDAAESILEEVRGLSHTVHSAVLDDLGLEAALKRLAREAANGNAIDFDVDARLGEHRVPRSVESTLFRVAQEAVTNATRHASPSRVRISLLWEAPQVVLRVEDDGRGFPVDPEKAARKGIGAMRERLALVDGWLDIESAQQGGTTVTATVPVADVAETPMRNGVS